MYSFIHPCVYFFLKKTFQKDQQKNDGYLTCVCKKIYITRLRRQTVKQLRITFTNGSVLNFLQISSSAVHNINEIFPESREMQH